MWLRIQTGCLVIAAIQKLIIWSRVGSGSCLCSTIRRGSRNRMQAVLMRRVANVASPCSLRKLA
jgi:hypothetical protein